MARFASLAGVPKDWTERVVLIRRSPESLSGALTLAFASIGHSSAHLFVLLYATVVLVLEREWGIGYGELLALGIPMMVMFGAGALPAGWLGDRWSPAGMMAVFFIGLGLASIATGLATSPLTLMAGLTLIGSFASIYHPVGLPWLMQGAANPGRALGVNGVFGSAGTAGAALVAGWLAVEFGWRAAFLIPGAACLAIGLLFVAALRLGLIRRAPRVLKPVPSRGSAEVKRVFLVLAVTVMCTGLIYQVTAFALPKIFADRLSGLFDGSVLGIGGMVALVYGIGAAAQILGGELADRYSLKAVYLAAQIAQVPVLILAYYLVGPPLVLAAALMVSLNVGGQPAENALLARYAPAAWRSRAFGAKFVLTLGVSSIGVALIPVVHGLTGGLDPLFPAMLVLAAIAAVAAAHLPGRAARKAPARQGAAAE